MCDISNAGAGRPEISFLNEELKVWCERNEPAFVVSHVWGLRGFVLMKCLDANTC